MGDQRGCFTGNPISPELLTALATGEIQERPMPAEAPGLGWFAGDWYGSRIQVGTALKCTRGIDGVSTEAASKSVIPVVP